MIETKKIALLLDVDNVKIGGEAFNELYAKLNEIGEVVYCKFYGYNDRKHIYLSDAIAKFGYETAPFMRYKKRFSQLDIRIIVDAMRLNYTKQEIDTYCIIAGDGDLIPLLVELKSSGRTLIDINTLYQEQNYHLFDAHINLTTLNEEVETYKPKTTKPAKSKLAAISKPSPIIRSSVSGDESSTIRKTTIEESVNVSKSVSGNNYQQSQPFRANTQAVEPEEVEVPAIDVEDDSEAYRVDISDELGDTLRDITTRYGELDFTTNSDIDKKEKLINDILVLIDSETSKGEGLNSRNADIRQIFVELQNIVDDMKSSL